MADTATPATNTKIDQDPPTGLYQTTNTTAKPTIVLVHGLWMTPLCWEDWTARLTAQGYTVIAPAWPGIGDRSPAEVRKEPGAVFAGDSIESIVDHYAAIINDLPAPPIIMGHSFGGLFVQLLLSRGLGRAGIAVSPAAPAGIFACG
jgi:non-heme chloroperoxidase